MLEMMDGKTQGNGGFERGLFFLLKRYKSSLPLLNDYFHKAFRQIDITDSSLVDMAIWNALQDSEIFWHCFECVQDEKDTDDKPN